MSNKADILVKNLKSLRNERGWSQEKVGQMVHKSRQAINGYENGVEPPLSTVIDLADVFGVSVDYLLGRDDPETGLSAEAVDQLKLWKCKEGGSYFIGVLNDLLSYDLKCRGRGKEPGHMAEAILHIGHIIQPNPERKTRINEHLMDLNHQLKLIQEDINPEEERIMFYFPALETFSEAPAKEQDPGIRRVRDPKLAAAVLRSEETPGE